MGEESFFCTVGCLPIQFEEAHSRELHQLVDNLANENGLNKSPAIKDTVKFHCRDKPMYYSLKFLHKSIIEELREIPKIG